MRNQLEKLCGVLEEELDRQRNVLAICLAQGRAARTRDFETLESKTASLSALLSDFVNAENERARMTREAARALGLEGDEHKLSELVAAAPEPWKGRLSSIRSKIRSTVGKTRRAVEENNAIVHRSLTIVGGALESFVRCFPAPSAGNYTAQVAARIPCAAQASVLDHRG